jgi:hypothetical protein
MVTGRGGPQICETSKLPHFLDNRLTDEGEVVSLIHRPPFNPQEDSWDSFLLETYYSRDFFLPRCSPTLGSLLPLLEHRDEFPQFLDQGQSVGLLGRVMSSAQGLYLYTNTEKRTHIHKH